jgi:1-deoxy-D-xylulose-5-phosphate synthase
LLNDNEMSISGNVGAISRHLGRLLTSHSATTVFKARIEHDAIPASVASLRRTSTTASRTAIKSLFVGNVRSSRSLGLRYIGPIDGHDLPALRCPRVAKDYDRPIVVHVATQKGRGYTPAGVRAGAWHGVGPFDAATGSCSSARPATPRPSGRQL